MDTRRAFGLFAVVLLAGCGGGGSSNSNTGTGGTVTGTPTGIFSGTSGAGNDVIMLVESSNKYWILYNPPKVSTEMSAFDTGTATLDLTDPANSFTVNAGDTDFTTPYSDPNASCFFATSLTVGFNGAISGTATDCSGSGLPSNSTVSGTLTARTDIDAFDVTLTFTGDGADSMPLDGQQYSGIAYYDSGTKRLFIAATTSGDAQGLGLIAVKH